MSTTNTTKLSPKIEQRLNILDKKLNLLLEELKVYSDDQLNRKPGKDKWSVIQNMHHLLLVEQASQRYLEKKLSFDPKLKNTNLLTSIRMFTLWAFLKAPLKWDAPKAVGQENLPEFVRFWDQTKKWKEQRSSLRTYLSTLPKETFRKEVYKHPRAGRLSIAGMLDSIDWHFDRHLRQIRNIIKYYPKQN
jgi:hypothetical protein